jgi:hypothetical protein
LPPCHIACAFGKTIHIIELTHVDPLVLWNSQFCAHLLGTRNIWAACPWHGH